MDQPNPKIIRELPDEHVINLVASVGKAVRFWPSARISDVTGRRDRQFLQRVTFAVNPLTGFDGTGW